MDFSSGHFISSNICAISIQDAKIDGSVQFGVTTNDGPVNLSRTFIAGDLVCKHAHFVAEDVYKRQESDGELVIRFEYRPDADKRKQTELNTLATEAILNVPGFAAWKEMCIRDSAKTMKFGRFNQQGANSRRRSRWCSSMEEIGIELRSGFSTVPKAT